MAPDPKGKGMQKLLDGIIKECSRYTKEGKVASYIPELAKSCPADFGIAVSGVGGERYSSGDCDKLFTMQSVVKPIILLLALTDRGPEEVGSICGMEATGKPFDAFNYSDRALTGEHINPMINAGAIALCTLIKGKSCEERFERLLELAKALSGNPSLAVDEAVYLSEKATGNKNRALAYMLKAYGMIDCDIEELLDIYFKACSIKVSCKDLSNMALVLANHGKNPDTGATIVSPSYARRVNATLTIAGMYDGSGEFALKVGIPAKSGVGGGIMAIAPGRMGIGIFSPALDPKGSSLAGIKALELLSEQLELSIF